MAQQTRASVFKISGMDCVDEVAALKSAVGPVIGGQEQLAFDVLNGRMVVTPKPGTVVADDAVVAAVARTGMRAELWRDTPGPPRRERTKQARMVMTAVSGGLAATAFLVHVSGLPGAASRTGVRGVAFRCRGVFGWSSIFHAGRRTYETATYQTKPQAWRRGVRVGLGAIRTCPDGNRHRRALRTEATAASRAVWSTVMPAVAPT